jgi:hypothetical protein
MRPPLRLSQRASAAPRFNRLDNGCARPVRACVPAARLETPGTESRKPTGPLRRGLSGPRHCERAVPWSTSVGIGLICGRLSDEIFLRKSATSGTWNATRGPTGDGRTGSRAEKVKMGREGRQSASAGGFGSLLRGWADVYFSRPKLGKTDSLQAGDVAIHA